MTAQPKRLKNPFYTKNEYADSAGRQYFFDNAKFVLIYFVVLAHAVSPFKSGHSLYAELWALCNTLHMPCMIFISGYFAKKYLRGPDGINVQRLFTYIVIFFAAQAAVTCFELFVLKNEVAVSFFSARSSLWFLQCLIGWLILLPVVDKFKPKYIMLGGFLFALAIGYDTKAGDLVSLSRMFVHFPFFMAGYYCTPALIEKLYTKKARIFAVLFTLFSVGIFFIFREKVPVSLITCNRSYGSIDYVKELAVPLRFLARVIFYFFASGLIISFLALTPRCKTFYTRFGARTLQVYILHRFLYLAYLEYDWDKYFVDTFRGRVSMIFIALALTFVLSTKPFALAFDLLQKFKIPKFLLKLKPAKPEGVPV